LQHIEHADNHTEEVVLQHLGNRYTYRRGDFATFKTKILGQEIYLATFRTQIRVQKRCLCNI
jgi:hypothetical protein